MAIRDNLGGGSSGAVLDTLEEIAANTESGKAAGALAVKQINESLGGLEFNVTDNKPQWREVGADTWNFFSSELTMNFDLYTDTGNTSYIRIPLTNASKLDISFSTIGNNNNYLKGQNGTNVKISTSSYLYENPYETFGDYVDVWHGNGNQASGYNTHLIGVFTLN